MAKIPTSNNMSSALPTATGNTVPRMNVGMEANAMANVAGGLARQFSGQAKQMQAETERKEEELDRINYNSALSQMMREDQTNQSEIAETPDYNSYKKEYGQKFTKTYDKYAATVPERYRADFRLKADQSFYRGEDKLSGIASKRQQDTMRASIVTQRGNALETLEYSTDPNEMQEATAYFMDSLAASSAYDEETKAKMAVSFQKEVKKIQQERTIQQLEGKSDEEFKSAFNFDQSNDVATTIARSFEKEGIAPETGMRIAMLESGGNVNAKNPKSSASGLFQFIDKTAKQYGVKSFDPVSSSQGAARLASTNAKHLAKKGVKVEEWHLYLAHQQGAGGAAALLQSPDENIVDVLSRVYKDKKNPRAFAAEAVELNGGNVNMKAKDFSFLWKRKFENADISKFEAYETQDNEAASLLNNLPVNKRLEIAGGRINSIRKSEFKKQSSDLAEQLSAQFEDDLEGQIEALDGLDAPVEIKDAVRTRLSKFYAEGQKIKKQKSANALKEAQQIVVEGGLIEDVPEEVIDNLQPRDFRALQKIEKVNVEKQQAEYNFDKAVTGSEAHVKAVKSQAKDLLLPIWADQSKSPAEKAVEGVAFIERSRGVVPPEISNALSAMTKSQDPQGGELVARFVGSLKLLDDRAALDAIPEDVRNYAEIYEMNAALPPQEASKAAYEAINPDNLLIQQRNENFDAILKDDDIDMNNILDKYGDQETFFSGIFSDARDLSDMAAENPQAIEMADEFARHMKQQYSVTNDMDLAAKRANEKILEAGWGRDFDGKWMKYAPSALLKAEPEFVENDFNATLENLGMDLIEGDYSMFATMDTQKQVRRGEDPEYLIMRDGIPVRDKDGSMMYYTPDAEGIKKEQVAFDAKYTEKEQKSAKLRSNFESRRMMIDLKRRAKMAGITPQEYKALEKEAEKNKVTAKNVADLISPFSKFTGDLK